MTLFARAAAGTSETFGTSVYGEVLDRYFDGDPDARTVELLE